MLISISTIDQYKLHHKASVETSKTMGTLEIKFIKCSLRYYIKSYRKSETVRYYFGIIIIRQTVAIVH